MTAKATAPQDWGLYVNECAIFASGIGMDRWIDFTFRPTGDRLTMLWTGPGGGEWHVMCGTREAAAEALGNFIEAGFHRSHVKVARLSACQAKARERGQRREAARAAFEAERAEEAEAWAWWANNIMPDPRTDCEAWRRADKAMNAAPGGPTAGALRLYREHLAREAA